MTCLCDSDIATAILEERFSITDFLDLTEQIQPASIDLRLGNELRRIVGGVYDTDYVNVQNQSIMTECVLMSVSGYYMQPGDFLLATTMESVRLGNSLRGVIHNKSTPARMGLSICNDSAFIDPGFSGQITLELVNHGPRPIILRPGVMLCQLELSELSRPCSIPYGKERGSHYQDQKGPTPATRQGAPKSPESQS